MLGGSLPWTYRGFRDAAARNGRHRVFEVRGYGPRPFREGEGPLCSDGDQRWKNQTFLRRLDRGDPEFARQLTAVGWDVPATLNVALADGRRHRFQEDNPLNETDRKRCFREFFRGPAKVLYLGAAWRRSSPGDLASEQSTAPCDLARKLASQHQRGSVIALHTGVVERRQAALEEMRHLLPAIDILFCERPSTLLSLLGAEAHVLVPSHSLMDNITLTQAKKLPPVTVVYQGYHDIAVIVPDQGTIWQSPGPELAGDRSLHTPVGLRSCFAGCFLHHFLESCITQRELDDQILRDLLRTAARDSLEIRETYRDFWFCKREWKEEEPRRYRPAVVQRPIPRHGYLIGRSPAMEEVRRQIDRVAPTRAPVLITGPSGVGKELAARIVHDHSYATGRFVALSCVALPSELLESLLFGHEKGAFTGAHQRWDGAFQTANNGTLFLDEIGLMPQSAQMKLLRALEEKQITRLGATEPEPVNIRFICATDRDPEKAVRAGQFLESLYYRINVYRIRILPLRGRKEDIRPLVEEFARLCPKQWDIPAPQFTPGAIRELARYDWPGNVRELRNIVERCAVEVQGDTVSAELVHRVLYPDCPAEARYDEATASAAARPVFEAVQRSDRWRHVRFDEVRQQWIPGDDGAEEANAERSPRDAASNIAPAVELEGNEWNLLAFYAQRPDAAFPRSFLRKHFGHKAVGGLLQRRLLLPTRPKGGRDGKIVLNPVLRTGLPQP